MANLAAKRPRLGDRTLLACVFCKSKKLKCDASIPSCQNCVTKEQNCLVEDPATGLLRPRNYMQSLETRVAYLEELLRQSRPDVASDHFPGARRDATQLGRSFEISEGLSHDATAGASDPGLPQQLSPQSADTSRIPGDSSDLASEVALLALGTAGREPQYFGPSSALSFARVAGASFSLQRRPENVLVESPVEGRESEKAAPEKSTDLPSVRRALRLSTAFFSNVHPQYPILHRPTFVRWEEQCRYASQSAQLETAPSIALFFVFMVYAIGALMLDNGDQSNAEELYLAAMENVAEVMDMDSLESIQALLMCAVYSIRSPEGPSIWKLSGMSLRHCIELGYHRSAQKFRPHADPFTNEMSKRVFWVAYDIDRAAAFALGRPFGIPDEMIDVELPLNVDDTAITSRSIDCQQADEANPMMGPLSGAIHIVQLRRIWSKISDSIYSTAFKAEHNKCEDVYVHTAELRQQLDQWNDKIPVQMEANDGGPITVFASKDWFRLAYCYSILLLYRHCLTCTQYLSSDERTSIHCTRETIDAAAIECANHAREICLLYRRTYQRSPVRYTWGSLHILFLGGLTYLHCLWTSNAVRRSTRQVDVINTCTACTMVLVIIAERWSKAKVYRDVFEQLSEQTIAYICSEPDSRGQTSSNMMAEAGLTAGDLDSTQMMPQMPVGVDDSQLNDWIFNLENVNVDESDPWFVQGLIRGFGDQPENVPFNNMFGYQYNA